MLSLALTLTLSPRARELAAVKVSGYTTDYDDVPIQAAARAALKATGNVLAVHCHQTGGGQYIDVGLVAVKEQD